MKKNGFTLVEMLAVITVLIITITIVVIKADNSIKEANKFADSQTIKMIEDAAYIYAEEYASELTNLNTYNVDRVTVHNLVRKGLLDESKVSDIYSSSMVVLANINGKIKAKYTVLSKPVIFLNGLDEVSIYVGDNYTEMGAYVATLNVGVSSLQSSNISSNLNKNVAGTYEIRYSYPNAITQTRIVNVISK